MTLPMCPICSCEAVDVNKQRAHSTAQSLDKPDAEGVVCYCRESHRFVVSPKERVPSTPSGTTPYAS